jgi:type IV pilus assembly protein PilQ
VRQAQAFSGIVIGGAVALLTTQPVRAAATQVTAIQVNESENELKLILETKAGDTRPQIFTVNRGNDLVTDIANTQLSLSKGDSFRQENPMPGITSLVVSQLNANSVRVTVSGAENSPEGKILQSDSQGITLSLSTGANDHSAAPTSVASSPTTPATVAAPNLPSQSAPTPATSTPNSATTVAQTPTPQPVAPTSNSATTVAQDPTPQPVAPTSNSATTVAQIPTPQTVTPIQTPTSPRQTVPTLTPNSPSALTQAPLSQPTPLGQTPSSPTPTVPTVVPPPVVTPPAPDVLVPNPRVTVEGAPAPATGVAQPVAPAPPFLPRAIAPPVGDIAISNINASAGFIDLGTAVRVPRLVLREAPIREVLALLARSAGLNVAFTGGAAGQAGLPPGVPGAGGPQQTISLDLENESVQDVFNYVLQISGLQANRVGRTILVGPQLPDTARNLVSRTLRLNQVLVGQAVGFLISQGAEQQQITTQTTLTVVGEGAAAQRIQNTTTSVQRIAPQEVQGQGVPGGQGPTGALVLRGLSVSPDERLNAVTLIGEPRRVEIATALLTQLDLRRRQVAVNVRVVDVNLSGIDAFNSSFSFGIGDSFFVNDGGAASFNYGGFRPPTTGQVNTSIVSPVVLPNPFANATVFLDPTRSVSVQGISPGQTRINNITGQIIPGQQRPGDVAQPFVTLTNPLSPGFTNITLATNDIITINTDGTTTSTPGTPGTVTTGLPSLFQYPRRLLTALQAQIQSGNAKILTDPTLVVQEGQTATVQLTQEVFGGIELRTQTDPTTNLTTQVRAPIIKNAGLTLQINVLRIDDNGFVTLTVNPIVSAPGGTANTPDGIITLVQDRRLESGQIRLRDAQTLILSGIIQETDQTTVSKVPILGDIPILGALFRSTNRANQRQEVIVLLTPQIVQDSEAYPFGYNYSPGREARQMLQRQGVSP